MSEYDFDACSIEKVAEPVPAGSRFYDGTMWLRPLMEVGKNVLRICFDFSSCDNSSTVIDGAEGNDAAMKIDTGVQHGFLLWVCELFYGFLLTTNHNHFSRLKGDLFENINRKEDARLLYMMELASCSCPKTGCSAIIYGGQEHDFFAVDVR